MSWEGSDPNGVVDKVLLTMCDVFGSFYLRDDQVLGALAPVPLQEPSRGRTDRHP